MVASFARHANGQNERRTHARIAHAPASMAAAGQHRTETAADSLPRTAGSGTPDAMRALRRSHVPHEPRLIARVRRPRESNHRGQRRTQPAVMNDRRPVGVRPQFTAALISTLAAPKPADCARRILGMTGRAASDVRATAAARRRVCLAALAATATVADSANRDGRGSTDRVGRPVSRQLRSRPSQGTHARRAQARSPRGAGGPPTRLSHRATAKARLAGLRSSREIGCPTRSGRAGLIRPSGAAVGGLASRPAGRSSQFLRPFCRAVRPATLRRFSGRVRLSPEGSRAKGLTGWRAGVSTK
jgi:hypothetical protein